MSKFNLDVVKLNVTPNKLNGIEVNEVLAILQDIVIFPNQTYCTTKTSQALEDCIELIYSSESFDDAKLLLGAAYSNDSLKDCLSVSPKFEQVYVEDRFVPFKIFRDKLLTLYKGLQVELLNAFEDKTFVRHDFFFDEEFLTKLGNNFKQLLIHFPCPFIDKDEDL